MATVDWSIKGPHFVNCNCDYGCPCQFNALPKGGLCEAVVAWRIEEGHFGDVRLDGLCAVNTYAWPGPIHKGGGTLQSIIDERANDRQFTALASILQGEGAAPGVIMLQIYRAMCSTVKPPLRQKVDLDIDMEARKAKLRVGSIIESEVEPIVNPVTGAQHRARIDLPMGKEFNLAEVASGTTIARGEIPLEFTKSHAHIVYNRMTSAGPLGV